MRIVEIIFICPLFIFGKYFLFKLKNYFLKSFSLLGKKSIDHVFATIATTEAKQLFLILKYVIFCM